MSRDIPLNLIDPDPNQPRQHFDEAKIAELAQSMDANGLAVPISVREAGDRFIIVHGERRYRAALALSWAEIRAEVRAVSEDEARWLSLVENVQRADLSPIEEARAYQARLAEGITQTPLAERIGKSQSYIAQKLRLLKLPDKVQSAIDAGDIAEGHARQLLRLKDSGQQGELCQQAISESWTVARIRLEIDELLKPKEPSSPAEMVHWLFEKKGGVPGHDPYPEERLPDSYDPPIAVKRLPIAEIGDLPRDYRTDGRDLTYPEWLAKIFKTLPPIAVFLIDDKYILADGKYRMMAAQLLGLTEIDCRIYEGKEPHDAEWYGVAANSAGGLGMREKDWECAIEKMRKLGKQEAKPPMTYEEALDWKQRVGEAGRELQDTLDQLTPEEQAELEHHELRISSGLIQMAKELLTEVNNDLIQGKVNDLDELIAIANAGGELANDLTEYRIRLERELGQWLSENEYVT